MRCRIVALCASGESDVAIGKQLSVNRKTVALWRNRFLEQGLEGLWEIAPGRGRKPTFGFDKVSAIVDATLRSKPVGQTHWSCREMAKSQSASKSTVHNIWNAHNLQPHRVKRFKLSCDPRFLRGGIVLESATERDRASRGRKESNPGAGSNTARLASEEGPLAANLGTIQ